MTAGDTQQPGDDELVDAMVQSAFMVMGVLSRVAADHDVSLTQLRVYGILRDRSPRMTELATFLGLDKSTMSGLVDRAEQRGMLARERSRDDARAVHVHITPAGRVVANRVHREVRQALTPAIEGISEARRRQLTDLLTRTLAPH